MPSPQPCRYLYAPVDFAALPATLARVRHEIFIADEIGELIDRVRSEQGEVPHGVSIDADLARVVARDWEKARRVPSDLRAEMAHASSVAETAWVEAKQSSDFQMILPHLALKVAGRNRPLVPSADFAARKSGDTRVKRNHAECARGMLESVEDVPLVPVRGPVEPGAIHEQAPVPEPYGKRDGTSREAVRTAMVPRERRTENVLVGSHVSAASTVPVVDKVVNELCVLHFGWD